MDGIPKNSSLKLVAWELTRRCNLSCVHCRASAVTNESCLDFDQEELTTDEAFLLIDEIAKVSRPILILTGGEPLLRQDIFKIASYGVTKGFRVVMATNGTLIDEEIAKQIKDSGIKRISISLDGADSKTHNEFRQVTGAFEGALNGIKWAKISGLEFQINTTITRQNHTQIDDIIALADKLGAVVCDFFFLVPTGRAKEMEGQELKPGEYEEVLTRLDKKSREVPIKIKTTCAPHYSRIRHDSSTTKGCLAGTSFCFISYQADVFPCGYLDVNCGNIRNQAFQDIWANSQVFNNLRDLSKYKGKCAKCEYLKVCGGCRARAYAKTQDYLAQEPNCIYEPHR
ncbi:MAG: radical SAM protein [bacterium]|nr:radical SAM protein [bacterium]